jgi:hypothetical protein
MNLINTFGHSPSLFGSSAAGTGTSDTFGSSLILGTSREWPGNIVWETAGANRAIDPLIAMLTKGSKAVGSQLGHAERS